MGSLHYWIYNQMICKVKKRSKFNNDSHILMFGLKDGIGMFVPAAGALLYCKLRIYTLNI